MRKIGMNVFASVILLAGVVTSYGQTADELIANHMKAIGGVDAWKKVTSMKMVGTMSAGGTDIPITKTVVVGKAMRVDFTVSGMTGYQIVTATEGWGYAPFGGQTKPEPLTTAQVKEAKDGLDLMPLLDYKAKGIKMTYLGTEVVDNKPCQKLKLVYENGGEDVWYFDAAFNHFRTIQKRTIEANVVEGTQDFSDFKKLPEGIIMAMTTDMGSQGKLLFKTVEVNKKIDESVFKPSTN